MVHFHAIICVMEIEKHGQWWLRDKIIRVRLAIEGLWFNSTFKTYLFHTIICIVVCSIRKSFTHNLFCANSHNKYIIIFMGVYGIHCSWLQDLVIGNPLTLEQLVKLTFRPIRYESGTGVTNYSCQIFIVVLLQLLI